MRISTTALEAVRKYLDPANEWMTDDKVVSQLRGTEPMSWSRRRGAAFGRVLETPATYWRPELDGFVCDGVSFSLRTMADALSRMDYDRGAFEVKGTKRYGDHEVVAVADQIVGSTIFEHKTADSFDIDRYLPSCQWRFLLDVLGGSALTYLVFLLKDVAENVVEVRGIESVTVFPYPGLSDECAELVRAFVDFATIRGLAPDLNARQQERAHDHA